MTPEQRLWERLRPLFVAMDLDPHRVENGLGSGTPDVNYCEGWVELKHLDAFPVTDIPVRIPKLVERAGQIVWLVRRWHRGGAAFLLLCVGSELFLFDGWTSRAVRQGRTQQWLRDNACWRSLRNGQVTEELVQNLKLWLEMDGDAMEPRDRARLCRLFCRHTIEEAAMLMGVSEEALLEAELHGTGIVDDALAYWEC